MAGALVGGAFLSGFLQVAFDRLASRQVVDFFRQRKLDETLLNQLKITILSMDSLSDDAELKQFDDPRVKAWLFAVKDAVFDAEDLLDEIEYEVIKCQVEAESESQTLTDKVSNFFNTTFSPITKKINSEMKQVLQKLEFLASQKDALGLKRATSPRVGSGSKTQTTSLLVESDIYGRDEDKEMIFNWIKSETSNRNQLSILSIVGMGGLGKTTLTQHVYNDPRMEEVDFDIKVWVCVSDDFDVLRLTKAILEAITGKNDDSGNLEIVHRRLKEELTGKRFLLVLDDVWNERRQEWEAVQTPLNYGATGSTILVTTRSDTVASTMRSCKVLRLKKLEEESCWQVFAKHAFRDDHFQLDAELKEIASKIIEKCKGLPLAIRSIGSLLRSKSSVAEWENVLKSKLWDLPTGDSEIIPALLLSYHHLPSHLKRCFSFCALFPKDYEFKKEILIQLWMAQNFLQGPQQSNHPEEVGEQYFDDLLSKSFFQLSSRYRYETCFVMHDLVNDLANYVCGDICFRLGVGKARGVPKTTRHFLIASKVAEYFNVFENLPDAKRLRTFFPANQREIFVAESWECRISIHDLFSKFKFLHFLSLSHCSDLREVPDSLGELKHLRSLNLSWTDIEKLPDSTCLLYNLQILKLVGCKRLEELPTKLYKLTNLRCLEFRRTGVRRMPMHFGKLKNLQVLDVFCADKSSEFSIRQLGGYNLRGELSIELQNIEDPSDALAVDLINKTGLEKLLLKWKRNHIPDDPRKEKEVLENLQPSKNLKNLSIENYGGTEFPSWLSNNSLSNVVSLSMYGGKYCVCLPPLGLLPSLKLLKISGFDGIVSVGAEFYGSSSSPFPSLEELHFYDMKEWEEWECPYAFPRLQSLEIAKCPKLKGLSEQLQVWHAASKVEMSEQLLAKRMDILLPSLAELRVIDCPKVEMLLEGGLPSNLKSVHLSSYKLIASLKESFGVNTCLKSLHISGVDEVEYFPEEGFLPLSLTCLGIWECRNLKKLDYKGLCQLSTLDNLILHSCPKLKCLPEEGLPKSISVLQILDCPLLKQRCQEPEGQDWGKIAHIQLLNIPSRRWI